jgi:outer membrane immunogenic protein
MARTNSLFAPAFGPERVPILIPMKRHLAIGIALTCLVAGATGAAASDLPARSNPPPSTVVVQPPFSWTGFYAGINGGYAWGQSSWSDPAVGANSGNFGTSGGLVGGQLGYNWQTGPFVLGVETDADWLNAKGSTAGPGGVCASDGGGMCRTQQSWLGTTRARFGYSFDRWLPYITGGVAYGNIQAVQPTGTTSSTNAGWTAGGGVEYGINRNWSAKLEYLHVDLGTASFMGAASGTNTLAVPVTNDLVRAGINYHW